MRLCASRHDSQTLRVKIISVSYLFKDVPEVWSQKERFNRIKKRASTKAWAFDLSVELGLDQTPWNVDESIRPRSFYGAWQSLIE